MDRATLNEYIEVFGRSIGEFIRREDRSALKSTLFDVARRTELGARAYRENLGEFVTGLMATASPEEIARRLKGGLLRPNAMHIAGLPWLTLFAREQERLAEGRPPGAPEPADPGLEGCLEFSARLLAGLRNDELWYPIQAGGSMPVLEPSVAAGLGDLASRSQTAFSGPVRRMAAALELYSFLLHGEHRDGIFCHGPYPAPDGRLLVVKEYTDLQTDYLPWAPKDAVPFPAIGLALIFRPETPVRIDLWGTLVEPLDYAAYVEGVSLFARGAAGFEPVPADLVPDVTRAVDAAQQAVYTAVLEWPAERRAEYGCTLFANHLRGLAAAAGADSGVFRRLEEGFAASTRRHLESILAREHPPAIWRHLAGGPGEVFSPYNPR